MGTSKGYGGPPTDLVPSWLGGDGDSDNPGEDAGDREPADGDLSPSPPTSGFTAARTAFTRFAKTGGTSSLGSALASYVRGGSASRGGGGGGGSGSGGARRAAHRMGASRGTGARLLGVVRDFQQIGATETLQRLNLGDMVNRPASDVFVAMLEFLCPPGGAIDEAISRQAMLEAIGNLESVGAAGFGELTSEQLREFFMDFVALSIEGRVIADIAARGIAVSSDIEVVETIQTQLHEFIEGCCRVHLSGLLTGLDSLSNQQVEQRANEIYEAAFSLIAEAGEESQ